MVTCDIEKKKLAKIICRLLYQVDKIRPYMHMMLYILINNLAKVMCEKNNKAVTSDIFLLLFNVLKTLIIHFAFVKVELVTQSSATIVLHLLKSPWRNSVGKTC